MLSQNTLVKAREAIEKLYNHTCSVVVKEEYTKPNHSTGFKEVEIISDQPCRISFSSVSDTQETSSAAKVIQMVKLFIAPEIKIPPGSKLIINHDGIESLFSKSGEPATYPTHQEIMLDVWTTWA